MNRLLNSISAAYWRFMARAARAGIDAIDKQLAGLPEQQAAAMRAARAAKRAAMRAAVERYNAEIVRIPLHYSALDAQQRLQRAELVQDEALYMQRAIGAGEQQPAEVLAEVL